MNKKFEDAVAKVRALAEERQEEAADLLLDYLNHGAREIYLSSEKMSDIERRAAEEPIASDDELRAVLSRLTK